LSYDWVIPSKFIEIVFYTQKSAFVKGKYPINAFTGMTSDTDIPLLPGNRKRKETS